MTTVETTRSGQSASGASGSTTQDLKADADRLKDTATDRASDMAREHKREATGAARSTADAMEKAASHLENDSNTPGWLASAFRETAKGIDRLAGKVEGRSPEELSREASRFAREHPGAFLAASAAAGFAAARFLRAGADYKQHHQQGSQSRSGQGRAGGDQYTSSQPATSSGRFADATNSARQSYGESRGGMSQ